MSSQLRWGDLVVAGDARRRELRERGGNGLDGVEVRDGGRRLDVYFFEQVPRGLHPGNIRIEAPHGAPAPSGRSRCTARRRSIRRSRIACWWSSTTPRVRPGQPCGRSAGGHRGRWGGGGPAAA